MVHDGDVSKAPDPDERTYFTTIEDAIADWGPPIENIRAIRDAVQDLDYEHVYIPASRKFIGLEAPAGGGDVGFVMPAFVSLQPLNGPTSMVPLPVDGAPAPKPSKPLSKAAAKRAAAEAPPDLCPTCFTVLPATKVCAYCE